MPYLGCFSSVLFKMHIYFTVSLVILGAHVTSGIGIDPALISALSSRTLTTTEGGKPGINIIAELSKFSSDPSIANAIPVFVGTAQQVHRLSKETTTLMIQIKNSDSFQATADQAMKGLTKVGTLALSTLRKSERFRKAEAAVTPIAVKTEENLRVKTQEAQHMIVNSKLYAQGKEKISETKSKLKEAAQKQLDNAKSATGELEKVNTETEKSEKDRKEELVKDTHETDMSGGSNTGNGGMEQAQTVTDQPTDGSGTDGSGTDGSGNP